MKDLAMSIFRLRASCRGRRPMGARATSCALALVVTASALVFGTAAVPAAGFLHASGTKILDGNNQSILLRSVNLGSWLWPELWMMGQPNLSAYAGADDFEKLNAAIQDLLGGDMNLTAQVLGTLRSNFITAADIVFLKSQGMNSVRVPFHYELFYQVTNPAASYPANGYDIDTGFVYLDNLVGWCATNGIYVIPDMHGVPGGKNYAVAGNVYTNASNHALFLHVWNRIAAHYATNGWIGGYDLLNEPVNSFSNVVQLIPGSLLSSTYADARNAIRSVDPNHMLFCEGDRWATVLSAIDTTSWTDSNVCYSDHRYGDLLPLGTDRKTVCVGQNVPLWTGEFGVNSTHWNNNAIANMEKADNLTANGRTATIQAGHAYWSYKSASFFVLVQNPLTAGWNGLRAYWASTNTLPKPAVADAFNWLMDYAQGTLFSNCLIHAEVADSLTRPNASFVTQRVPYRNGMTIPGRILATDYDMGAQGIAYNDTVYDDEAGAGVSGRVWNNGWYGRDDGVDTASCRDASALLKIAWNDPGEWQRYTVSSSPGLYNLNLRYGAGTNSGQLRVFVNGINVSGTVALPSTGSSSTYSNYTVSNVAVDASGTATVQVQCDAAGYHLLWIEFEPVGAAPLSPQGLVANAGNGAVSLDWIASSGATGYRVKRATTSGGPYTTVGSATAPSYHDSGLTNGAICFYLATAVNPNGESTNSAEANAIPQASTLPSNWVSQDVGLNKLWSGDAGDVGLAGDATLADGTYTLSGSGIDIWGPYDSYQYAYRAISGDCTIIARVVSLQYTDPWAKAGVMIRETLHWDSANALMAVTAQHGTLFSYRSETTGNSSSVSQAGNAPYWVKLVRTGNTFTGYRSNDGTLWTYMGAVTIPMATDVFVGLAVTAHNNTRLNSSTFDNVSAAGPGPPLPGNLTATASNAQVVLKWSPAAGAIGYNVKRSITNGGPYFTIAAGLPATNYIDLSLTNGTTYYYVVSSLNLNGESPNSSQVRATPQPPPPAAPTGLTAFASVGQVTLNWNASAGAVFYRMKRSTTSKGPYFFFGSSVLTNDTDLAVTNETTYYYVVSAANGGGESANSAEAAATPHAPPQLNLSLAPGSGLLTLAWPDWADLYTLWSAADLTPPVTWFPEMIQPQNNNSQWMVTIPVTTNDTRYYRLQGP